MVTLAVYIMAGFLIIAALLWLLCVMLMTFNAVVDWFMR